MIETLQSDFITATGARLDGKELVYRHALRNSFIPILTLLGLQLAILMAGLCSPKHFLARMGLYIVKRIELRDYTAVQSACSVCGFRRPGQPVG
jgi:peptide/nickel transport system permease protein